MIQVSLIWNCNGKDRGYSRGIYVADGNKTSYGELGVGLLR